MTYFEVYHNDNLVITCSSIAQYMQHMRVLAEEERTTPKAVNGGDTLINGKLYTVKMV